MSKRTIQTVVLSSTVLWPNGQGSSPMVGCYGPKVLLWERPQGLTVSFLVSIRPAPRAA